MYVYLFDTIFQDEKYIDLDKLTSLVDIRTNRYVTENQQNDDGDSNIAFERDVITSRLKIPFINIKYDHNVPTVCTNHRNLLLNHSNYISCIFCGAHQYEGSKSLNETNSTPNEAKDISSMHPMMAITYR